MNSNRLQNHSLEADLRLVWPVLLQLIENEWPGGLVHAAKIWGGATDEQADALDRLQRQLLDVKGKSNG